ncbi:MAG: hypothetical protein CUN55_12030 [Phototrophicales bacterium]|nr:MAG: hypothetical protein CUN55_12030 [Phototrophicales bacterium]
MRRWLWLFVFLWLLAVPYNSIYAYPGGDEDENCEALREAAIEALEAGIQVEEPDCVSDPGRSAIELRAAYGEMAEPSFTEIRQLPINEEILYQRRYIRIVGDAQFYDAPHGNVVGSISRGYNFASYRLINAEGWVQLTNNQWVPPEFVQEADVSSFTGIEILQPLTHSYAWMIRTARPSRYPGGPEDREQAPIRQYTLLTIYATEFVDGWEWYMVGPEQWLQQTRVAKLKPVQRPAEIGPNDYWIAVDLFEQTAVAYEGDRMVFATLISSGLPQWSTNEGLFKVYIRATSTPMTGASGQPSYYFIENVPWVMYFDGDIALHGAYWHDLFGYRQSKGCVNLSILDAWWLYRWSEGAVDKSPYVYVYSSGEYRDDLPAWARRPR